jgi:hypothetical protein
LKRSRLERSPLAHTSSSPSGCHGHGAIAGAARERETGYKVLVSLLFLRAVATCFDVLPEERGIESPNGVVVSSQNALLIVIHRA